MAARFLSLLIDLPSQALKNYTPYWKIGMSKIVWIWLLAFIPLVVNAQDKTRVKGVVTDAVTGEPLPFVNISFVDKNIGTTTDFNGKYSIETNWGSDKLQASFLGYEAQQKSVVIGSNQTIDFKLESTSIKVQEVTVKAGKAAL
jgi:hypothetical protein